MKNNSTHDVVHKNVTPDACWSGEVFLNDMPADFNPSVDNFLKQTLGPFVAGPPAGMMSRFLMKIRLIFHPAEN